MFLPKRMQKQKHQKNRSMGFIGLVLPQTPSPTLFAVQEGFWAASLVAQVFIKLKKLSKAPIHFARFWINLHTLNSVTRKTTNSRMGKGKGSHTAWRAQLRAGQQLVRFFFWRQGLIKWVFKYIKVRSAPKLQLSSTLKPLTAPANLRFTERRYLKSTFKQQTWEWKQLQNWKGLEMLERALGLYKGKRRNFLIWYNYSLPIEWLFNQHYPRLYRGYLRLKLSFKYLPKYSLLFFNATLAINFT